MNMMKTVWASMFSMRTVFLIKLAVSIELLVVATAMSSDVHKGNKRIPLADLFMMHLLLALLLKMPSYFGHGSLRETTYLDPVGMWDMV